MDEGFFENKDNSENDYPFINLKAVNFDYAANYHTDIEVIYVASGNITIKVDGADKDLFTGDIYIVMPGEIHSFTSDSQNVLYIIKLHTNDDLFYSRIEDGRIAPESRFYARFKKLIERIAFEDTAKYSGYRYAVKMCANELVLDIIRCLKPVDLPQEMRKNMQKKLDLLKRINIYMESHYKEKVNLAAIADHLNYSTYYVAHMFKGITNQSFGEYVTDFRLEKFLDFFLAGGAVTQTALDCGFGSVRSFNRCFKKRYDMSPLEYKAKNAGIRDY